MRSSSAWLTTVDLVGSIDEFATKFSVPTAFIGLILLPIVGNAAEHVTAVWMALKGKMELTIGGACSHSSGPD